MSERETLIEDMKTLLAYAQDNDQCDTENFAEMAKIAERWKFR